MNDPKWTDQTLMVCIVAAFVVGVCVGVLAQRL
jgi:uncharacterized membrane-anchored protein YhcB (DUF1043 family)